MPRKSRSTQAPVAAPGQQYGKAGASIQAQQALPLPQAPNPADMIMSRDQARGAGPPAQAPTVAPAAAPPPGGGGLPPELLMQLAQQTPGPGQGSINEGDFHTEPLTSGMPTGPGPGSGALGYPDVSPVLRALAETTGDSRMLRWAQIARLRATQP